MTRFEVLRGVAGVNEYSTLIFDILRDKKTPDDIAEFLSEELTESQLRTVASVAGSSNYLLSFDGIQ